MDLCPLRAGLKYYLFSSEGSVSPFSVFWGLQLIPLFFFSPKKPLKDKKKKRKRKKKSHQKDFKHVLYMIVTAAAVLTI